MMTTLARVEPRTFRRLDPRLALLIGQSISLGILLSLLIITASALFLTRFGSQALPYVYISVAVLGSTVFYGYAELQRRFSLPALSIATIVVIALWFMLSWLGLTLTNAAWITFLLMVSFSLIIQMGFVLLGNQAGRLFDVREIKSKFPRIVAGFAVGFMVGGFIASLLANVIGRTENLLLLGMASSLSMLVFLLIADSRYHAVLSPLISAQRRQSRKPLWQLMAKRFVLLTVMYQMLSAMVSQLLDFMLFDQAATRYTDSLGLAQFLGNYTIALNSSDILFLALFAGLLLTRFGLKFGLSAKPIVDGIFLLAEIVVGLVAGIESHLLFILVMAARVADITLTDGTTRGSINVAYQALPADERIAVQTGVEGIGVPIALGLTGAVLLLFNAIGGVTILHIVIFTLIVTLFWTVVASMTFGGYAESLIRTLRRRALDSTELTLDDGSSLAVVEGLLQSDDIFEVRLALDMLESCEHETLDDHLISISMHPSAAIRTEALNRIERRNVVPALPAVRSGLRSERNPLVKAAAIRALCALDEGGVVDEIIPYLSDANHEVQYGAAVGMLRYGGISGVLAAGQHVSRLEHSADPAERKLAARVIGGVGAANFYRPLTALLIDADKDVRRAALISAGLVAHPRLLPLVIDSLERAGTQSAAMTAAIAYGKVILPHVQEGLDDDGKYSAGTRIRLLHACGQIGGNEVVGLLKNHFDHPDGEVRTALFGALSLSGYRAGTDEVPLVKQALEAEVRNGARLLISRQELGEEGAVAPLQRALADEFDIVRQRIFLLLSFVSDHGSTLRAAERLKSGSEAEQAMALETLSVSLPGDLKKLVLPLVDPALRTGQRLGMLTDRFPVGSLDRESRLAEIIGNVGGVWVQPWIQACAYYAAGKLGLHGAISDVEMALTSSNVPLRQTAAWALHALQPERFEARKDALLHDPDPQVAHLAAELTGSIGESNPGSDLALSA